MAWGVGGYFEKRGLLLGQLSPQIGIILRTFVVLLILWCGERSSMEVDS